jgi:hypothetical protein
MIYILGAGPNQQKNQDKKSIPKLNKRIANFMECLPRIFIRLWIMTSNKCMESVYLINILTWICWLSLFSKELHFTSQLYIKNPNEVFWF